MTLHEYIGSKSRDKKSKAAVKIAPVWEELPEYVQKQYKSVGAGLFSYIKAFLDEISDRTIAVVIDIPSFEVYGMGGIVTLKTVIDYARQLGLVVIADTQKACFSPLNVKKSIRAWVAPVDDTLPEDSPLREGGFDCDALTFEGKNICETGIKTISTEIERYSAGVFTTSLSDDKNHLTEIAENIGVDKCGVILYGSCKELSSAVDNKKVLSICCPTGFENEGEMKELAQKATLILAPSQVQTPASFKRFLELI